MTPFSVAVPQAVLDRLLHRLADAYWAVAPDDDADWTYGTERRWLEGFVDHWLHRFDWRAAEARLNAWPQFTTPVDGVDIHFYHVQGSAPTPRPLLLTHGWPGSVVEFLDCIERLAHPHRFGGDARDGFDLVIPSLPGYGFSGKPPRPIGPRRIASMWRTLMVDRLGYRRFAAQGGDWGAAVTTWLGADHADVVAAIHLNMLATWTLPDPADTDVAETPEMANYRARVARLRAREMGYYFEQSTKPQTIALALADSPLGFAAWVCEKFRTWGDTRGDMGSRFSHDTLITNLMTYLATDSVASAIWLYRGRADEAAAQRGAVPLVRVPTAVALYPAELIPYPPRALAERSYTTITRWTEMSAGGHFAALEEPQAFCNDVHAALSGTAMT
jgi:pimeloyl-ACP methyl ester carboxylesterase